MQLDLERVNAIREISGCSEELAIVVASESQFFDAIQAADTLDAVKAILHVMVQCLRPVLYHPPAKKGPST